MNNHSLKNSLYKKLRIITCISFLLLAICNISSVFATYSDNTAEINTFVKQMAKKYKYSPNYIHYVLSRARYNPDVILHMNKPYEALPWFHYRKLFLTEERINGGVSYWDRSDKLLAWEEKEYKVPSRIILAIIGIESKYGQDMGHFPVLDVLSTLAFHYPPRKKFFQKELAAFIAYTKIHNMDPSSVLGSYAGAMGQAQFMPTSMLYYSVDFQGKDEPNLFHDKADVIFSIGNYLRQNGWEPNQPVAVPARIVGNNFHSLITTKTTKPTTSLAAFARHHVYPAKGNYEPYLKANLIKLQGKQGPEYWLVFNNFHVITTYNSSNLYAMAAYQLANHIQDAYTQKKNKNVAAMKKHQHS